jgi:hypothetical protein
MERAKKGVYLGNSDSAGCREFLKGMMRGAAARHGVAGVKIDCDQNRRQSSGCEKKKNFEPREEN